MRTIDLHVSLNFQASRSQNPKLKANYCPFLSASTNHFFPLHNLRQRLSCFTANSYFRTCLQIKFPVGWALPVGAPPHLHQHIFWFTSWVTVEAGYALWKSSIAHRLDHIPIKALIQMFGVYIGQTLAKCDI